MIGLGCPNWVTTVFISVYFKHHFVRIYTSVSLWHSEPIFFMAPALKRILFKIFKIALVKY